MDDFSSSLYSGLSLFDALRYWKDKTPDAEAVIGNNRRLNYHELYLEVVTCAYAMLVTGVKKGDRIATLSPPCPGFLVVFLATTAIGAIWVGLNPKYVDEELNGLIKRLNPVVLFIGDEFNGRSYDKWLEKLEHNIKIVNIDDNENRIGISFAAFVKNKVNYAKFNEALKSVLPDDPCLIVFTSGSTGQPNGTMISSASLTGASRVQLREWSVTPLRILNNLPINHIGCVGDISCYSIVGGGTIVFMSRFEPAKIPQVIEDEAITIWAQVPTMFQFTINNPAFEKEKLQSLKLIFWGGENASRDLVKQLQEMAPVIATSYGQTETVGSITFTDKDDDIDTLAETVGHIVPPYEIKIINDEGAELAFDESGEILVRTPFGMIGYFDDEDAVKKVINNEGWQKTGDVGFIDYSGNLHLIGRVHDIFKSGGYNIYPAEIEDVILSHPLVDEVAIIGVNDAAFGNVAVAYIVSQSGVDADVVNTWARAWLANFKIPKHFIFMDELPRLPIGKVDKKALLAKWNAGRNDNADN